MWERCSPRPWPPGCTSHRHALGEDIVHGHGVRGGKAMIATPALAADRRPGRLIRHARHLILRLPPAWPAGRVLARLRALPAPA